MNKYVECQNCKYQYYCERTYLGGCTDGKKWEEEHTREEKEKTRKETATEIFCDLETELQARIELYLAQGNTQAANTCKTLYNYICTKAKDYNVEVFDK